MKKYWLALLLLVLTMVVAACSGDKPADNTTPTDDEKSADTAEEGGKIKIDVLASLTGALESYEKQTQRGFDLGIEYETDGSMEVNGKIRIIYEDTILLADGYRNVDFIDYQNPKTRFMYNLAASGGALVLKKTMQKKSFIRGRSCDRWFFLRRCSNIR